MKVLINTPSIKEFSGGVASHYKGLKKYWSADVSYNIIGNRNYIPGIVILPFDLVKFAIKCIASRPDLIVLNPSLTKNAVRRDAQFLKIAKLLKIVTIVYFHGWNDKLEQSISINPRHFKKTFNDADAIIVLAAKFKNTLQSWGIDSPIYLSTTQVDDALLQSFNFKQKEYNQQILFLARIDFPKGILVAIEAFAQCATEFPEANLLVVGKGPALDTAKSMVNTQGIKNVRFTGKLSGDLLQKAYETSSIYVLPTTHGEGLPTSILEAMAFGLPIITRPVGGIPDFFVNEEMGYLVDSKEPADFCTEIRKLLLNKEAMKNIGITNYNFATARFKASIVAANLELLFQEVLKNNQNAKSIRIT